MQWEMSAVDVRFLIGRLRHSRRFGHVGGMSAYPLNSGAKADTP